MNRQQLIAQFALDALKAWVNATSLSVHCLDIDPTDLDGKIPRDVWESDLAFLEEAELEIASRATQLVQASAKRIEQGIENEYRALDHLINPDHYHPEQPPILVIISSLASCLARNAGDRIAIRLRLDTTQASEVERLIHETVYHHLIEAEVLDEIVAERWEGAA